LPNFCKVEKLFVKNRISSVRTSQPNPPAGENPVLYPHMVLLAGK